MFCACFFYVNMLACRVNLQYTHSLTYLLSKYTKVKISKSVKLYWFVVAMRLDWSGS